MLVGMKYGKGEVQVNIPDSNLVAVLELRPVTPIDSPQEAIFQALQEPIGSVPLAQLATGKKSACVVISDITRPVPNKLILPPILKILEENGIQRENIVILIATGIHRPNEGKELEEMVGLEIMQNYKIVNHFSGELNTHKYLGLTKKGTPVYVDKTYLEADLKITTALIEPHLMAGYSGGRKAICPGISAIETMRVMHGPKILEHPKTTTGVIEGNPFHEEATEIAKLAGVDFIVNVAIDRKRRLIGVFAGDLVAAHIAGIEFVEQNAKVVLPSPVDIVLTTCAGYPLDATFYQAIKGLVGAMDIVKPGGSIILLAECSEGVGSQPFTDLVIRTQNLQKFVDDLYDPQNFVVDQWQLEELAKVARKAEVYCYSDGIPYDVLGQLFVYPLKSPEEGINLTLQKYGSNASIIAIPEGPYILPVVFGSLTNAKGLWENSKHK
ncbi:nickel-dependent lactate racemase [Candidatus Poribacteria bacterium]|nr:nickel-dependent lactate racemase [Candidatus Poribacteria bacterium]